MTSGNPDDGPPFAVPIGPPERRRARNRINYPLIIAGAAVLGLAAAAAFVVTTPFGRYKPWTPPGNPSRSEAKICFQDHDLVCAEADYAAYLEKYPNDPEANATLAIVLTQDGQHKAALYYYKRAVALGVATYDTYAGYAESLEATGDFDGAIRYNYAALKLAPSLVDVRGALADQLVKRGRRAEAINLLESFDESFQDQTGQPYFQAQIDKINAGVTGQQIAAATSAAGKAEVTAPLASGTQEIGLSAAGGTLYLPVRVDDALTLPFVVDSGASDVTIPADIVQTLIRMGKVSRADYRGQIIFRLADGSIVPSQLFVIHSMRIGNREVRNVTGSITNKRGALLLGQSFLRRFKSWSIDNRRRVLVLQN